MTFVLKDLKGKNQFLSPVIQTEAIQQLTEHLELYHQKELGPFDKPTCVVCFDMSGTGKTTAIVEASKNSNSIIAPISLIDNVLLKPLLNSCKNMGRKQDPPLKRTDFIDYDDVTDFFEKRFQTVLAQLFEGIIEQLNRIEPGATVIEITIPKYISPTKLEFPEATTNLSDTYGRLVTTIQSLKRLLVIHLDDCQEFFCGLTRTPEFIDGKVKVGDIMGFALRLFSKEVADLGKSRYIMWIFSGTRPNLDMEMRVASKFEDHFDVVDGFCDFKVDDIMNILKHYYYLGTISQDMKEKMANLCGPPKFLYWFLKSAQKFKLSNIDDMTNQWDEIERKAIGRYRKQIKSTINSFGLLGPEKMEIYARNLCLLHTHAFLNSNDGYLEFDDLPNTWIPFVESGLIRTREVGDVWKLFPPNRFLIKIFNRYVKWFTWENIQDLVANIKASAATTTLKGKVFEYLFALELLATSDSKLWKQLGEKMKVQPKVNWKPSIKLMGKVTVDLKSNEVYVMTDPDYRKSKTDVLFFADRMDSKETVRVLCQLTTQVDDSTFKAKSSFLAMFGLVNDGLSDYRLYLAPKSTVTLPQDHEQQFSSNNCFWIDSSSFGSMLKFSWDLCDPKKTEQSLTELMNFAASLDDNATARNISNFIPGSSKKRKREFESFDIFYKALEAISGWENEDTQTVKNLFGIQRIKLPHLATLTDLELEKIGLVLGLRKVVLSVIENV